MPNLQQSHFSPQTENPRCNPPDTSARPREAKQQIRTMSSHLADLGIPAEVRSKLRGHARGDIADVYEVNHMVPQQREAYTLYAGKILDERGEF